MILIEEANTRKNVFYKYFIDNESDKKTLLKTVEFTCESAKEKKDEYYILYDSNMIPIKDFFSFINYQFLTDSPNTKFQAISALRLLYSFLELFDLDFKELTDDDINNLKYFLRGYSPKGSLITINLNTNRSNTTINTYLSMFRRYADFLNIKDSNLNKISPVSSKTYIAGTDIEYTTKSYAHNEPVNEKKTVPRYISVAQYKKVLEIIDRDYTIREKCMVRLMFEAGLRIGEVLGLTSEDIQYKKFTNPDTEKVSETGVVYIRNRITDKKYQLAKGLTKPTTRRAYSVGAYKDETTRAYITLNLYDLIDEYIENFHNLDNYKKKDEKDNEAVEFNCLDSILNPESEYDIKKKNDRSLALFKKNYEKYTITDIVDKKANTDKHGFPILKNNFYIFINSLGKPLSIDSWNKILREIFKKSGIKLDSEKKEHNLSHRFRHGYAMYLARVLHYPVEKIQKRLRHKSIKSTLVYFRPTEYDIAISQEEFSKSLENSLAEEVPEDSFIAQVPEEEFG